jgi:hypothetical protein
VYQDPDERPQIYDPRQTQPVATPKFRLNLVFDIPENFGPSLGDFHLLGEWYFNALYHWDAGRYFTYNPAQIEGIENSMRYAHESLGTSTVRRPGETEQATVDNALAGLGFDIGTYF